MATNSIKSFLVLNLLLSVTLVSTIAIVGNLFLEHQGFQKNLDSQLSLTAHTILAFTSNTKKFDSIQKSINNINAPTHSDESINTSVQYLIIDHNSNKAIQSKSLPEFSIKKLKAGYHDLWLKHSPWRLFHLYKPERKLSIYTIQRHDFRAKLEREITEESFIIMLITYPFLGLLIWAVVNKGLSSLAEATKSLRRRKRSCLIPLEITDMPTEVEPLIKAINSLLERLDDSFQREQRFAGDAAHELKTPLAALSAHLQLAQEEHDPKKIQQALTIFSLCVDRSAHVVEQLLTLSRMTPGAEINDPQKLNLTELAQTIIIELLPQADKKQIQIELISDSEHSILGNSTAILILLRNLIDNAIRYSPEASLVTVKLMNKGKNVILEVIDQGPGVPDKLKTRIFERFFRVVGNKANGSGLGLGIVKEIVDFHNAKIKLIDANPGLNIKITFDKFFC